MGAGWSAEDPPKRSQAPRSPVSESISLPQREKRIELGEESVEKPSRVWQSKQQAPWNRNFIQLRDRHNRWHRYTHHISEQGFASMERKLFLLKLARVNTSSPSVHFSHRVLGQAENSLIVVSPHSRFIGPSIQL